MKNLFLLLTLTFSTASFAAIDVQRRDMKLASQVLLEKQTITDADLAGLQAGAVGIATTAASTTTVTTFVAQPDVCRNVTIDPGGTTASVPAGDVVINGTNFFGRTITESITFLADATAAKSGLKAFCSLTSVVFPVQDGAGATYDIGYGDVLGLKRCMDVAGHVAFAVFDGAYETTRPTCVADADEIEKNTCDINGTLDGSKDAEIYFIQNFRCLP